MKHTIASILLLMAALFTAQAQDTVLWRGSMTPYDLSQVPATLPDTLEPIGVVHMARHGARYMTSPSKIDHLRASLAEAAAKAPVTQLADDFNAFLDRMETATDGRWGLLDSVGYDEERTLGARIAEEMGPALHTGSIEAWSTYVPRAIMSMYAYTYRLAMLEPYLNIQTHEGPRQDPLLRFFDTDSVYAEFLDKGDWHEIYDRYVDETVPIRPAAALVSTLADFSDHKLRSITMKAYAVVRSAKAMGLDFDPAPFFTDDELMACWKADNLRHYLCRTQSQLSDVPVRAARPLLEAVIADVDRVSDLRQPMRGMFYFAHAETLMPLFSLMDLPGCNAPDAPYAEVWQHWRDTDVVPLAANLDVEVWLDAEGTLLVSTVLNGRRIPAIPGGELLTPWNTLKAFWNSKLK